MLTTLILPKTRAPKASVAMRITPKRTSSQIMGSHRRCVSQNRTAMIIEVPVTEPLMSFCIPCAISITNTGRPVYLSRAPSQSAGEEARSSSMTR